jgi:hypothetical protein
MSGRGPDWTSEVRFTVSGLPADGLPADGLPAEDLLRNGLAADERPVVGVPVRWCALLALVALGLAAGGGALLNSRRDRTVTSTQVRYEHPNGVDLSGCPRGDVCMPLPAPEAALGRQLPPELARGTTLTGSLLLDTSTSTSTTIRTLQVLSTAGLTVTVTGQCIAGAAPVPARELQSAPGGPARAAPDGPTEVALVRPGRHPGCSVALLAQVPAGKPVPVQLLRRLADELVPLLFD